MSNTLQIQETVKILKKDIDGRSIVASCVSPTESGVSLSVELEDGEKVTLGSVFRDPPDNVIPLFYAEMERQL